MDATVQLIKALRARDVQQGEEVVIYLAHLRMVMTGARHHYLEHLMQDAVRIAAIPHRRRKPAAYAKLCAPSLQNTNKPPGLAWRPDVRCATPLGSGSDPACCRR
jgi:hypothetical protein